MYEKCPLPSDEYHQDTKILKKCNHLHFVFFVVSYYFACGRRRAGSFVVESGARNWENEMMKQVAAWLNENCRARKEPQLFGIAG